MNINTCWCCKVSLQWYCSEFC